MPRCAGSPLSKGQIERPQTDDWSSPWSWTLDRFTGSGTAFELIAAKRAGTPAARLVATEHSHLVLSVSRAVGGASAGLPRPSLSSRGLRGPLDETRADLGDLHEQSALTGWPTFAERAGLTGVGCTSAAPTARQATPGALRARCPGTLAVGGWSARERVVTRQKPRMGEKSRSGERRRWTASCVR